MKTFVIAIVVLGLITCGVMTNAYYIHSVTDTMISSLETLPEQISADKQEAAEQFGSAAEKIVQMQQIWERNHFPVSITVAHTEMQPVDQLLIRLNAACSAQSRDEFQTVCELLNDALQKIRHGERLSIDGII